MSKISITPNASGTGVFTIASPATSTDRTLTLPDITGTLVSTDASGNVGIGGSPTVFGGQTYVTVHSPGSSTNVAGYDLYVSGTREASLISYPSNSESLRISGLTSRAVTFYSNDTERMRIDSTGNVGIGVSSITNPGGSRRGLQLSNGTNGGILFLNNNASEDQNPRVFGDITNQTDLGFAAGGSTGTINYYTNNAERMRIDSSGNVLVGTTVQPSATTAKLLSSKTGNRANIVAVQTDAGGYNYTSRAFANGSIYYHFHFEENATSRGSITSNGSSVSYNTSSDYRLKTDAQPMTGASTRVQALKPVNFEWIASGTRVDGFLAHEAQAVVPECVTGTKDAMRDEEYEVTAAVEATYDEDGNELTAAVEAVMGTRSVPDYQGIDQSKLVPLLTAALQEALTEISALKARVTALEAN